MDNVSSAPDGEQANFDRPILAQQTVAHLLLEGVADVSVFAEHLWSKWKRRFPVGRSDDYLQTALELSGLFDALVRIDAKYRDPEDRKRGEALAPGES